MTPAGPSELVDPELGAELIDAADSPLFAQVLLGAARRLDSVEEVFAYAVTGSGRPKSLCASGGLCNSSECAERYERQFYQDDPLMTTLRQTDQGSGFARHYRAADIRRDDYRALCFDRAHFVDKLCFGWRGQDRSLVVSFYRTRAERPRALERFTGLATVGLSALARSVAANDRVASVALLERLEQRLSLRFPELSPRERAICAQTLAGHTAEEIAVNLGIRRSTVLTYRLRAYQRYGFTGASAFLGALVN